MVEKTIHEHSPGAEILQREGRPWAHFVPGGGKQKKVPWPSLSRDPDIAPREGQQTPVNMAANWNS